MHLPHAAVRHARRSDRSVRRRTTVLLFVIAWGCASEPDDEIASTTSASVAFTPVVDTRTRTLAGPAGGAPPSTFRETDVVHVGGNSSARPPLFVTASGTGARVFLKSWRGSVTGGVAPTELGTSPIINGHDVRLHALTPDTSPKSAYRIVVSGMIDLFTLWITTWRVGSDGSFTQLDSLGYGGTSKQVAVFDIAHRPITTPTGVGSFVVTTPVRIQAPAGLRVVTWVVNATTGDISAGFESGVLTSTIGAASNVSAARVSGHEHLPEYVAISVRNNVNDLANYFVQPHPNGLITPHGGIVSALNIGGTAAVTEPIYAADVHALTGYGMVTAIERLDDTLDLLSFDNRVVWNEGAVVTPHAISSDSLDLLPGAPGVSVAVPNFATQNTFLADADHGATIYRECSDFEQGIASVTKSMTLLVALDAIAAGDFDLDTVDVEISAAAAGVGGSQTGFTEGETHSLRTLLWGLMIDSGNDAAVAIAEHVGGSLSGFVAMMNAEAADLGMSDSIYCQPAGGCFSTVVDQANLWTTVANRADFQQFAGPANLLECGLAPDGVSEACYFFDKTTDQHPGVESWKGGSLGFFCGGEPSTAGLPLCASGGCLSAQARRIDRTLVLSELQPSTRPGGNIWPDARKLWDFGYRRIFTPDFLGTGPGRSARDFGIDFVHAGHVVTALVRADNQVELCSQAVSIGAGTVGAPACRTATDPGLPVSPFIPIPQHVEIEQLSNVEADGDYVSGQRAGNTLRLRLWRVGPHEVPDHVEGSCCGDGVKQADEECDGNDFGTQSCGALGWDMGSLECTDACRIDIGGCYDGPGSVPPGSYGACGYDAESCDNSPAHCDADGSCLGGPCQRTNPDANPLDPFSGYHPDGDFVDEEGNLYFCPDPEGEEWVCSDEDGWGVCRRCADSGDLSTRVGCGCTTDDQCDDNEPGLGCYGEDFAGDGYCYSATEGPPYWQCEEGACGTSPYYSALYPDGDDVTYCHHYWQGVASNASCQNYYNCNSILADICTLTGNMCTYGSDECTDGDCCEDICTHNADCSEAFGWPADYVCDPTPGRCIPDPS